MQAINAIYDGNYFKPIEPVPVNGKYEVVITFTKPIDTKEIIDTKDAKRQRILKYFGTWSDDDVKMIDEIVEERARHYEGIEQLKLINWL